MKKTIIFLSFIFLLTGCTRSEETKIWVVREKLLIPQTAGFLSSQKTKYILFLQDVDTGQVRECGRRSIWAIVDIGDHIQIHQAGFASDFNNFFSIKWSKMINPPLEE